MLTWIGNVDQIDWSYAFMPLKIFFCYAREDERLLKKLETHLMALRRQGLIDIWHDRNISAGTEWEREINKHLNEADIILLLISPDFMASEYCYSKEMKWAMDRHDLGEALVIPVILRPVDNWKEAPFGKLQALPRNGKPVTSTSWGKLDIALSNVSQGILRVIYEITDFYALRHTLSAHPLPIWSIAISPDGQTLASGSDDTTIKLWNLQTGELRHTLAGHSGYIWCVIFSPDGQTLASASQDTTIKLWNLQTGELRHTLLDHSNWVKSISMSPDGQTLVSSSADGKIKLWNPKTGRVFYTLEEHPVTMHANSVVISPNGQLLASGSEDGKIKLWDLRGRKLLRTLEGHFGAVHSLAFHPHDRILVSGCQDSTIKIWDLHTGRLLSALVGHTESVNSVAISSDGRTLASGSDDATVKLWSLSHVNQGHLKYLRDLEDKELKRLRDVRERGADILDRLPSREREYLSGEYWRLYQDLLLQTLTGHSNWVKSVAFSPTGRLLASSSSDHTIKIWEKKG